MKRKTNPTRPAKSRRVTHPLETVVTFADAGALVIDNQCRLFIQGKAVELFASVDWLARHGAAAAFTVNPVGWTRWLTMIQGELAGPLATVAAFVRDCRAAGLKPAWVPSDASAGPGVATGKRGGRLMQFADGFGRVSREEERTAFVLSRKYPHKGAVVTFNQGRP